MSQYNAHTHIFTMSNAPVHFLDLYIPKPAARLIDKLTNTAPGARALAGLLETIGLNGCRRYASFLRIGKSKAQGDVLENLLNQYKDTPTKFLALTLNMEYCGAGASVSGFEGQLEEAINLKKQYPEQLILFLGLDPRWKATGRELQQTVAKYFDTSLITGGKKVFPFTGLKLYPSTGFYPFDQRLRETFEWAADRQVPIISHCNYLGGIYNNDKASIEQALVAYNPYKGGLHRGAYIRERHPGKWLLGLQQAGNNLISCSYFLEPYACLDLLQHFESKGKPLKLCLAHFGGDTQVKTCHTNAAVYGMLKQNWFRQVQSMMSQFPGLYTDVSYALHDARLHDCLLDEAAHAQYGNRVLFGTDYFLTERKGPERRTYTRFRAAALHRGLWDQVAGSNVANFLTSAYYQP